MNAWNFKDLTGLKFGKWTVLRWASAQELKEEQGKWLCRCMCGAELYIVGSTLTRGLTTQCKKCYGSNRHIDLKDQRFGKWTAICWMSASELGKRAGKWLCRCDCGTESLIGSYDLTHGNSTQCKRCYWDSKLIDLTGKRFGKWTVLRRVEHKGGGAHWTCVCDCGNELDICGWQLRNGQTTQCRDCQRPYASNNVPPDTAEYHMTHKSNAKYLGYEFTLTTDDIEAMRDQHCHYCHVKPDRPFHGIDRVDSSRGYTQDNIVPCCFTCNRAKSDMPVAEFLAWLKRVGEVYGLRPQAG